MLVESVICCGCVFCNKLLNYAWFRSLICTRLGTGFSQKQMLGIIHLQLSHHCSQNMVMVIRKARHVMYMIQGGQDKCGYKIWDIAQGHHSMCTRTNMHEIW